MNHRRKSISIVIIQGHPDPKGGHFGHALAQAYEKGASEAGHKIQVICLAQLDFPLLRGREDQHNEPPVAIAQAQSVIAHADHLLMIYPLWNGGAPALVRGFLEQTFRPAFIFPDAKPGVALGFFSYYTQRKALTGKTARIVVTMQMPAFVYRWYFRPHVEKNMLRISGMRPVTECLIGGIDAHDAGKRERWLHKMHALGGEGQ
jgi:putative NADPH-quinone reductase